MQYELFYLIGASREGEMEKIKNETEEIVKSFGGNFLEKTTVEKRRLSYEIKHETHGIYIARRFELEDLENLKEINKKMNLSGDILRFIISRTEELPALKSKEERMNEVTRVEKDPKIKKEEKAPIAKKELFKKEEVKEKAKKEEKTEEEEGEKVEKEEIKISKEEVMGDDDIDKKLEEILNI
jgi:ribosomal protein S6